MYKKQHKVNGGLVNDDMLLKREGYYDYLKSTLISFLFYKGYTLKKLNAIGMDFTMYEHQIDTYRDLGFTDMFTSYLQLEKSSEFEQFYKLTSRFLNENNELCAVVSCLIKSNARIDFENISVNSSAAAIALQNFC